MVDSSTPRSGRRARGYDCPCCGGRVIFRVGQVWSVRGKPDVQLRIVSPERDGAIVEQVGRESVDPRWGVSYSNLVKGYVKEREA